MRSACSDVQCAVSCGNVRSAPSPWRHWHTSANQTLRPLIAPPALLPSTLLLTTLTSPPHQPHLNLVPIYNHPLRNAMDNLREIALARFSLGRRVGTGASENVYEGSID